MQRTIKQANDLLDEAAAFFAGKTTLREFRQLADAYFLSAVIRQNSSRRAQHPNKCKAARAAGIHRNTLDRIIDANRYLVNFAPRERKPAMSERRHSSRPELIDKTA